LFRANLPWKESILFKLQKKRLEKLQKKKKKKKRKKVANHLLLCSMSERPFIFEKLWREKKKKVFKDIS